MNDRTTGSPGGRVHVMHVYSRLGIGGIEHQMLHVLPRLNSGRYRASLCLLKDAGVQAEDLRSRGVDLHVLPLKSRLRPSSLAELGRLFRRTETRIVQSHVRESNTSATAAGRLYRIPVVIGTVHSLNTIRGRRRRLQDRILAAWRDVTVAVSERVRRNYCETIGVSPARVTVIYNGVDLAPFEAPAIDRAAVRAELGLGADDCVVACVARLVPPKAHEVLLAAAARVLPRAPRTTFLLIGDGPLAAPLREQARTLGIASRVHFAGPRDDVPRLLRACDASVLTSTREGFSVVVVESLAAGLPVVATDVGGNAEAIEEGVCGMLVAAGDVEGVADRLTRLALDSGLRARMGEAARLRARRFSLEETVKATESLYDRLLRRRGIEPPSP